MRSLFLALIFVQILCACGCSRVADPHDAFARENGGIESNFLRSHRARLALNRLTSDLKLSPETHLRIWILHNPTYCAYSFSDGSIYLSAAIVDRLNDDELTAVIAHEIGHMIHDRVVQLPSFDSSAHAALLGKPGINGQALEITADALGRQLLIDHHLPHSALADALTRVALPHTSYYPDLQNRIAILRAQDR